MTSNPDPPVPPEAASDPALRVTVARSGGVAGVTRRWCVTAPPQEATAWIELVERCPWEAADDAGADAAGGACGADRVTDRFTDGFTDRFTWTIEADLAGRSHRAVIPETQAQGAWRALIDAVRTGDSASG